MWDLSGVPLNRIEVAHCVGSRAQRVGPREVVFGQRQPKDKEWISQMN